MSRTRPVRGLSGASRRVASRAVCELDELARAPVFCSWSGGKDSALALHESIVAGADPRVLITMMTERGMRSRSHGLHRVVLERQAAAIGIPIQLSRPVES